MRILWRNYTSSVNNRCPAVKILAVMEVNCQGFSWSGKTASNPSGISHSSDIWMQKLPPYQIIGTSGQIHPSVPVKETAQVSHFETEARLILFSAGKLPVIKHCSIRGHDLLNLMDPKMLKRTALRKEHEWRHHLSISSFFFYSAQNMFFIPFTSPPPPSPTFP